MVGGRSLREAIASRAMSSREYWQKSFNTELSPENEQRFVAWVDSAKERFGTDLSGDIESYDLRGYWLNGGYADEEFMARRGHAPDTYKKPNHPTFSNESIYHGAPGPAGVKFEGGEWIDEMSFRPSRTMLKTTHDPDWYRQFMDKHGEGVSLIGMDG